MIYCGRGNFLGKKGEKRRRDKIYQSREKRKESRQRRWGEREREREVGGRKEGERREEEEKGEAEMSYFPPLPCPDFPCSGGGGGGRSEREIKLLELPI